MDFTQPIIVYSAATNVEAHLIVEMLHASGIPAYAVEDQSGVSLWAFGTISQFHKPNIWVDQATADSALQLIHAFEDKKQQREANAAGPGEIEAVCEECGKTTTFPGAMDGSTQECSHCHAYIDVGELPWDEDFGTPED